MTSLPPLTPLATEAADATTAATNVAAAVPSVAMQDPEPIGGRTLSVQEAGRLVRLQNQQDWAVSMRQAINSDPTTFAEARRLSGLLNVPLPQAETDIGFLRKVAVAKRNNDLQLSMAVPTWSRAMEDPAFARMAWDDSENLSTVERLAGSWQRGRLISERGELASMDRRGQLDEGGRMYLAQVSDRLRRLPEGPFILGPVFEFAGQQFESAKDVIADGVLGAMAAAVPAAALSAAGPQVVAAPLTVPAAAAAGFAVAGGMRLLRELFETESGNSYADMIEAGYDPSRAAAASIGVGIVNTALEVAGGAVVGVASRPARQALRRWIGREVASAVTRPGVGGAVAGAVRDYSVAMLGETATEVAQEVSNIVGEWAARRPEDAEIPGDVLDRLVDVAVKTAQGMSVLALPGAVARFRSDRSRASAAMENKRKWDQITQAVQTSKTLPRDPDMVEGFLGEVLKGKAPDTLFVDGATAAQVLRQIDKETTDAGRLEKAASEQLDSVVPGLSEQIAQAEASGSMVQIPAATFATKLAGLKVGMALDPHIRIGDPDAMTATEAQASEASRPQMERDMREALRLEVQRGNASSLSSDEIEVLQQDERLTAETSPTWLELVNRRREVQRERADLRATGRAAGDQDNDAIQQRDAELTQELGRLDDEFRRVWTDEAAAEGQRFEQELQQAVAVAGATAEIPAAKIPTIAALWRDSVVTLARRESMTPRQFAERFRLRLEGATDLAAALQQPGEQAGGNRGGYDPNRLALMLTKQSDASTVVHELGHFYVDVLMRLSRNGGSARTQADVAALAKWWGVADLAAFDALPAQRQEAALEAFTYNFEAYLATSTAPSIELQGIFDRLRAWMTRIYVTVRDRLARAYRREYGEDLPVLTPDVRAVFDGLLASQEQIELAEKVRGSSLLFATPEQRQAAGVTPERWAEIQALDDERKQAAIRDLTQQTLRRAGRIDASQDRRLRRVEGALRAKRAQLLPQVEREVDQMPVYRALRWLRTGEFTNPDGTLEADPGASKLNTEEVRRLLGAVKPPKVRKVPPPKSLLTRVRELGGISRESAKTYPGEQRGEFRAKGVFRREGGMAWEALAQQLSAEGYGPRRNPDESFDPSWFVEALQDAANGLPMYRLEDYELSGEQQAVDRSEPAPDDVIERRLRELRTRFRQVGRLGQLGVIREDGTAPVDVVGQMFGYETGEVMVHDLLAAPRRDELVQSRLQARMLSESESLWERQREVDAAMANEVQGKLVAAELRELLKSTEPDTAMIAAAREAARVELQRMPIGQISSRQFLASERRAAAAASQALASGKLDAAIRAKRQHLVQHHLVRLSLDVEKRLQQFMQSRVPQVMRDDPKTAKLRDENVVGVARAILARHNFAGGVAAERAEAYLQLIQTYDPDLFADLNQQTAAVTSSARPWQQLTLQQFDVLADTIAYLWDRARNAKQLVLRDRRVERDDAIQQMLERAEQTTKAAPERLPPVTDKDKAAMENVRDVARFKRLEHWVRRMDGGPTGPWQDMFFRPLRQAYDSYLLARQQMLEPMRDRLAELDLPDHPIEAPELGTAERFESTAQMLGAIQHMGNDSNAAKLVGGYQWGAVTGDGDVDVSPMWRFLNRMVLEGKLTEQHLDYLQWVGDQNDKVLKPMAQQANRIVAGRYFRELPAKSFTVRFPDGRSKTYRGWYVPAKVDKSHPRNDDLQQRTGLEAIADGAVEARQMLETTSSFRIARVPGALRPLVLDIRQQRQHLDEVLRFVHLQPTLQSLAALVRNQQFAGYLNATQPGAIRSMIVPWLEGIARNSIGRPGEQTIYDRIATWLRRAAARNYMFLSARNALQQITGVINATIYVSPRYLLPALWRSIGSSTSAAEAMKLSEAMRVRLDSQINEIEQDIDLLVAPSKWKETQGRIDRHTYVLQRLVQSRVDVATWWGAFDERMAALGADRTNQQAVEEAVAHADSTVRLSQGSNSTADVSAIERGSASWRLVTQFMSYFNVTLNQILGERTTSAKVRAAALGTVLSSLVASAITEAFTGGQGWDDENKDGDRWDDVGKWFLVSPLKGFAGMLPVIGPAMANVLTEEGQRGDRLTLAPFVSMMESGARALRGGVVDLLTGEGTATDWRDLAGLLGMATGLPIKPVGSAIGEAIEQDSAAAGVGAVIGVNLPDPNRRR